MIDYNDNEQLTALSEELIRHAKEYSEARNQAARAKHSLDIILASKMSELRQIKSNLGYETAQIMLLETSGEEVKNYYRTFIQQTGKYKGLEKVVNALQSQISLAQSIIKNQIKNT